MKVKNTLVICQSTNESLGQSICHLGHLERHDSVGYWDTVHRLHITSSVFIK